MASFATARATGLLFCGLAFWGVHGDAHCTNGRLFVADKDNAKVHVLDLDDTNRASLASFDAQIAGARLYAADSDTATVMSIDRGTTEKGSVLFFSPGLSGDDHGDHVHVTKSAPSAYSYNLTGWKPTHVTSSVGYLNVFMDGVWSSNLAEEMHNSSAVFIKEADLSSNPVPVEVPVDGAHHGVCYALSDSHFLTTVSTAARSMRTDGTSSLPGYFVVASSTGEVVQEVGNESVPSCPAFHGAGHIGTTVVTGCGSGGWLRMSYTAAASEPVTWERVPFPSMADGAAVRSGTVRSHKGASMFAADVYPSASRLPRYVAPMLKEGSASANNLVQVTSDTENDMCHWAMDQASTASGTHLVVLSSSGNLSVTPVGADAVAGTTMMGAVFDQGITCSDTAMVAGHGVVYILVGDSSPRLLTVDLEEILEGHADHAVSSVSLSFKPSGAALALPRSMACAPEAHDDHEHETSSALTVMAAWPLLGALLWA